MQTKTARLFTNGGSQAVRLPAEFRFPEGSEVYVRRDPITGDIVLSARPNSSLSRFFAVRDQLRVTEDPAAGRPHNVPVEPRRILEDD
jgi:virulence-associated protein VagC